VFQFGGFLSVFPNNIYVPFVDNVSNIVDVTPVSMIWQRILDVTPVSMAKILPHREA
jgi:hypothetical protein